MLGDLHPQLSFNQPAKTVSNKPCAHLWAPLAADQAYPEIQEVYDGIKKGRGYWLLVQDFKDAGQRFRDGTDLIARDL